MKKLHKPTYICPGGLNDQVVCSCGWRSNVVSDLVEACWDEWLTHAKMEGAIDPNTTREKYLRSL